MAFDWRNYLTLAEELTEKNTEACYRSAISRAYYAVFHILKDKTDYNERGHNSHLKLINGLKNSTLSIEGLSREATQNIGNQLFYLKKQRQISDYQINVSVSKNQARKSCRKAKVIFNKLESCSS